MTFWLVGEAPNRATVGKPELWLRPDSTSIQNAANRLLGITGWSARTFLRVFDRRTNVWPVPSPLWMPVGRARAARIIEESSEDDSLGVVILGARAADAFGLSGHPAFEWAGRFALIHHPSPRCRYWNSPGVRDRARAFFDDVLARHEAAPRRRAASSVNKPRRGA